MANPADTQAAADQALAEILSQERGSRRAEAVHRLQIGFAGLGAMVLMIGLATVIMERAQLSEALSVPDAASTTQPAQSPTKNDPLAEAGVVPDMPAQTDQQPEQEPAIVPEQGNAAPTR